MRDAAGLLLTLAVGGWIAYAHLGARDMARRTAARICRDMGLQHLDESIALAGLRPAWTHGRPAIRRRFGFEFSTDGTDRRHGDVAICMGVVEWVRLEHPDGPILVDPGAPRPVAGVIR